jgi:hypothetical protein
MDSGDFCQSQERLMGEQVNTDVQQNRKSPSLHVNLNLNKRTKKQVAKQYRNDNTQP